MAWLLLTHAVALALLAYAPFFWVKLDAAAFAKAPANDVYHGVFHRQRLTWRVALAMVMAALASLPMVGHPWYLFALSMAGLLAIGGAWFAYVFNPGLNRARNLPYVGPYYVSADPRAAFFPDRWAWGHAMAHYPPPATEAERRSFAELLLKTLLTVLLWAGCLSYAAALVALWWLQ